MSKAHTAKSAIKGPEMTNIKQSKGSYKNYIEKSDRMTLAKQNRHITNIGQRKQLYRSEFWISVNDCYLPQPTFIYISFQRKINLINDTFCRNKCSHCHNDQQLFIY